MLRARSTWRRGCRCVPRSPNEPLRRHPECWRMIGRNLPGKPRLQILREHPRQVVGDVLDEAAAAELRQGAGQQELNRHIDVRRGRRRVWCRDFIGDDRPCAGRTAASRPAPRTTPRWLGVVPRDVQHALERTNDRAKFTLTSPWARPPCDRSGESRAPACNARPGRGRRRSARRRREGREPQTIGEAPRLRVRRPPNRSGRSFHCPQQRLAPQFRVQRGLVFAMIVPRRQANANRPARSAREASDGRGKSWSFANAAWIALTDADIAGTTAEVAGKLQPDALLVGIRQAALRCRAPSSACRACRSRIASVVLGKRLAQDFHRRIALRSPPAW